jgi:hypothetical protein
MDINVSVCVTECVCVDRISIYRRMVAVGYTHLWLSNGTPCEGAFRYDDQSQPAHDVFILHIFSFFAFFTFQSD